MPHISRTQSLINKTDNGGAGMKKPGLIRDGYPRVSHRLFMTKVPNKLPTVAYSLTDLRSSYGRASYIGRNRIV